MTGQTTADGLNVPADLRSAADLIERDGWAQKVLYTRDGCHCAVGAIMASVHPPARSIRRLPDGAKLRLNLAVDRANMVLGERYGAGGMGKLMSWNDSPLRSADQVVALLRAAAEQAEAGRG